MQLAHAHAQPFAPRGRRDAQLGDDLGDLLPFDVRLDALDHIGLPGLQLLQAGAKVGELGEHLAVLGDEVAHLDEVLVHGLEAAGVRGDVEDVALELSVVECGADVPGDQHSEHGKQADRPRALWAQTGRAYAVTEHDDETNAKHPREDPGDAPLPLFG